MSDWDGDKFIKTQVGGLNALSMPNGEFITYSRAAATYELLLTNFVDGTETAWFDLYVEDEGSIDVMAVHPRDGLAANGVDWDDREEDFGEYIHLAIGDSEKDGEDGPFAAIALHRDLAKKLAHDILEVLKATEGLE